MYEVRPCWQKVFDFLGGDTMKTIAWFDTPNPGLGNVSPYDMIMLGKEKKLEKFIDDAMEMNKFHGSERMEGRLR